MKLGSASKMGSQNKQSMGNVDDNKQMLMQDLHVKKEYISDLR